MIRPHVLGALFRRNFVSYFSSATSYVFIMVMVALSAFLGFFLPGFFSDNLATLSQLNLYYPLLLLFMVPAITMGSWAEERRQGTDELLLTLPAGDTEILLGKYLAATGIYTVTVLYLLSFTAVLAYLGDPDWGVLFGTYLGYWMLGATLISIGMVASFLTSSMTVAFILGALFCALMVGLNRAGVVLPDPLGDRLESLSVVRPFAELASGVLSARSLVHLAGVTALFLYLNRILLGRRHLGDATDHLLAWTHLSIRSVSLLVAVIGAAVLAGRFGPRFDLTSERLFSLSETTEGILNKLSSDRPVYVHAYLSPEVPRDYVQTRENLLAALREFDARGGDRVHVKIVATRPFTKDAREADERFGIRPRKLTVDEDGHTRNVDIFLGVAMTSGPEETVIPFMYKGLSVEYELALAIAVSSGALAEKRRKVGVVTTDAKLFGGFDFDAMSSTPAWSIIEEMRKQYEVVQVTLDPPPSQEERWDVLLVPMPSSLTQPQMDQLAQIIRRGIPTLVIDDPMPLVNPSLAPTEPKRGRGRNMFGPPPGAEQKGDIAGLLESFGIRWDPAVLVWDSYTPHKKLSHLPKEFVFIGSGSGTPDAFNPADLASSALQEIVVLCAGRLQHTGQQEFAFTPLLKASRNSGTLRAQDLFQRSFFGISGWNPNRRHRMGGIEQVLAARIRGTPVSAPPENGAGASPRDATPPKPREIHLIMIADLDLISEQFFEFHRGQAENLDFDNVTFVLNCIDSLAQDSSMLALRKRRPRHRTLITMMELTREFTERQERETEAAEQAAEAGRKEAQQRMDDKIAELNKRTDLDDQTRQIMLQNLQEVENRRLQVVRKNIDDEKHAAIERSFITAQESIRTVQLWIKATALALFLLPLIPAGLGALISWIVRLAR